MYFAYILNLHDHRFDSYYFISLYRLRLAAIGHAKPSHVHPALHDG